MVLLLTLLALAKESADPLAVGKTANGRVTDETDAVWTFAAPGAGLLAVGIRGDGETDLKLVVADEDGQPLPDARSDQDVAGNRGAEQLVVALPYAAPYQVRVEAGDDASFAIAASFVPMSQVERAPDTDGRPGGSLSATIGEAREDRLAPGDGDRADWFALKAKSAGTVTIVTKAADGDLILEAFADGSYGESIERSDSDLQDTRGNESVTVHVDAGQVVRIKVSASDSTTGVVPYRLSSGIIAD